MTFFKSIGKFIKDQIKWGNRSVDFIPATTPRTTKATRGRTLEQNRKRNLRKISRASRRLNIRLGYQGSHS